MDVREKIARAMYDQRQRFVINANKTEFDDLPPITREMLITMAEPVIAALRDNDGACPVCGFVTVPVLKGRR